jgi:hypothetical protein
VARIMFPSGGLVNLQVVAVVNRGWQLKAIVFITSPLSEPVIALFVNSE